MAAATRDPTPPGKGALRSALAGVLITAATSAATRYGGPEAGDLAGRVAESWLEPAIWSLVGGAVLGVSTLVRKAWADVRHLGDPPGRLFGMMLVALVLPGCAMLQAAPDADRLESLAVAATALALADDPGTAERIAALAPPAGPATAPLESLEGAIWSHYAHALRPEDEAALRGVAEMLRPDLRSLASQGTLDPDAVPLGPLLDGVRRGASIVVEAHAG